MPEAPTRVSVDWLIIVEEVGDPQPLELAESLLWSIITKVLLRLCSLRTTLSVLDRVPRRISPPPAVRIPPEHMFGRAGACLGRQVARSQYLRRRGCRPVILIGVRPGDAIDLDAHAWLEGSDEAFAYQVLHRIER